MDLFSTVKTNISTIDAAERYGIEVKRNGKALCPFHNDRHPSLFVDDDHYHCYACGEHGDVIDFTAKLYGLSLYDAAKKLAYDFGITQNKPPDKVMQEKQNRKIEAQRLRENEKLCFSALMEYMKLLQEWKLLYAPRAPEDTPHDRFVQACHKLDYVEYLVDLLIMGDSYERTEVIDRMMTDGRLKKLQTYLEKVNKEEKVFERRNDFAR
ncbi:MAG: CHC2 zinc finger domain-containing protein [Faecousia sp.]